MGVSKISLERLLRLPAQDHTTFVKIYYILYIYCNVTMHVSDFGQIKLID